MAGRLVSRDMHVDAVAAKRQGVRVLLTTPGGAVMDETHDVEVCANCGGLGSLYLQSLVAGPFRDPPAHGPDEHVGVHNGQWWKMTLRGYHCPVCRRPLL